MKIQLNRYNFYYSNKTINKSQIPFGISATETAKLSFDLDRYESSMTFFPEYTKFFLENISSVRTKGTKTILDVGSNQGELTRNIRKFYPQIKTINLDLTKELHKIAKEKDKNQKLHKNVKYMTGNAMKMPVLNNSIDAILFSRVIHEVYSYDSEALNAEKFSIDSVERTFLEAGKKLKRHGRIIMKDPAKPEDYNKLVSISDFSEKDKFSFKNQEELKSADVTKLKGINLLKRFCIEFEPADGYYIFNENSCIMPKWLASEYIRHRKFNDTKLHWADEINEQYGIMTNKEYKKLAETLGFKIIKAEHNFKEDNNNFYAINNEFKIFDMSGKELIQSEEFPVDQYLVLEKK
ncbi:MAG: methyltransferase domain-containing protein [Clostridium sp.]|nr:methyltransferase domain-containing protein [Clostridium sp.]